MPVIRSSARARATSSQIDRRVSVLKAKLPRAQVQPVERLGVEVPQQLDADTSVSGDRRSSAAFVARPQIRRSGRRQRSMQTVVAAHAHQ